MTLRGELDAFPLETVVQLVHSTNKTGQLEVRGTDETGGTLGFDGGRLIAAVAGEEVGEPALGAVFAISSGAFEFIPWNDAPAANLSGDLDQLLDKAVEERDRIVAIRKVIPDDRSRFRLSERAADKGDITLSSEQWRTLLAVNGDRDVTGVAEHLRGSRLATRASLAALVESGFVDVIEPAAAAPPPPPAPAAVPESVRPAAPAVEAAPAWTPPAPAVEAAPAWTPPAPAEEAAPAWTPPAPAEEAAPAWTPPAPEARPEPAPEPSRRTWRDAAPPAQSWEQPAEPPAPQSWEQPASPPPAQTSEPPAPQSWERPAQTDIRDDLAAALDARIGALSPAPAVEPEVPPEPSPIDIPPAQDERLAALSGVFGPAPVAPEVLPPPEPATPAPAPDRISEWSRAAAPPEPAVEEKKKGRFGFLKREEAREAAPAPAAVEMAGGPGRAGQLASLANALLGEYNSGHYGKGRLDDRMANLLMRVDEQADPIDRPLPIIDDRIDSQALDRENVPEQQALPYLALLVSQIFEDAERTFGKDKAKRGYKAAQQQVFGSDTSTLSAPDVAGRLPKV